MEESSNPSVSPAPSSGPLKRLNHPRLVLGLAATLLIAVLVCCLVLVMESPAVRTTQAPTDQSLALRTDVGQVEAVTTYVSTSQDPPLANGQGPAYFEVTPPTCEPGGTMYVRAYTDPGNGHAGTIMFYADGHLKSIQGVPTTKTLTKFGSLVPGSHLKILLFDASSGKYLGGDVTGGWCGGWYAPNTINNGPTPTPCPTFAQASSSMFYDCPSTTPSPTSAATPPVTPCPTFAQASSSMFYACPSITPTPITGHQVTPTVCPGQFYASPSASEACDLAPTPANTAQDFQRWLEASGSATLANLTAVLALNHIQATDITTNQAKISWKTNNSAKGIIEYGTKQGQLNLKVITSDGNDGLKHTTQLSNLSGGKKYYYRVIATDVSGVQRISAIQSFKTYHFIFWFIRF